MIGILFSKELIPAVLNGTKTVTRRVESPLKEINKEPDKWAHCGMAVRDYHPVKTGDALFINKDNPLEGQAIRPRYQVGETVYVKEAWYAEGTPYCNLKTGEGCKVEYRADDKEGWVGIWRSPLFMPEWASRKKLLILETSVERLQEITPEECIYEGFGEDLIIPHDAYLDKTGIHLASLDVKDFQRDLINAFKEKWNSINKDRGYSWETNPWLIRYRFKEG